MIEDKNQTLAKERRHIAFHTNTGSVYLHADVDNNDILKTVEAAVIRLVLEECRYNQSKTALALNISRGTLRTKLQLYFKEYK